MNTIFPKIKGDSIIQIGLTSHMYGDKTCSYNSVITLGSCDDITGVDVYECETEKELLIKWSNLNGLIKWSN